MSGSSNIKISIVSNMTDSLNGAVNKYESNIIKCSSFSAFSALENAGFDISCCSEYDNKVSSIVDSLKNTTAKLNDYIESCNNIDKQIEESIPSEEETEEDLDQDEAAEALVTNEDVENMSMTELEDETEELNNAENKDGDSAELKDEQNESKTTLEDINNKQDTDSQELKDNQEQEKKEEINNINNTEEPDKKEDKEENGKEKKNNLQNINNSNNANPSEALENFLSELKNISSEKKELLLTALKTFADKKNITILELINNDNYIDDLYRIIKEAKFSVKNEYFKEKSNLKDIRKILLDIFTVKGTTVKA